MTEHASIEDALNQATKCLGGHKKVGVRLRPELEKDPEGAGQWWRNCVNPEHSQKPSIEQVLCVMRWAQQAGCHVIMNTFAGHCGYAMPEPITPANEAAELRRKVLSALSLVTEAMQRIEQIERAA